MEYSNKARHKTSFKFLVASSLALCLSIQEARAEYTINGIEICYGTNGVADTNFNLNNDKLVKIEDRQGFYQAKFNEGSISSPFNVNQDFSLIFTNGQQAVSIGPRFSHLGYLFLMGGDTTASRKPVLQLKTTDKGLMIKPKNGSGEGTLSISLGPESLTGKPQHKRTMQLDLASTHENGRNVSLKANLKVFEGPDRSKGENLFEGKFAGGITGSVEIGEIYDFNSIQAALSTIASSSSAQVSTPHTHNYSHSLP